MLVGLCFYKNSWTKLQRFEMKRECKGITRVALVNFTENRVTNLRNGSTKVIKGHWLRWVDFHMSGHPASSPCGCIQRGKDFEETS